MKIKVGREKRREPEQGRNRVRREGGAGSGARDWGREVEGRREGGREVGESRRARVGAGAGAPRAEGRGLGLPLGGRGRGGEGRGLRAAAANLASSAGRLWRRRRPGGGGPTDRRPRERGPTAGLPEGTAAGGSGGGRCAALGPARAGAAPGADRSRTAPQHRAKQPASREGQCPQPSCPSGLAGRVRGPPPGSSGGGGAGGFVLSRRQWGRGGLGLRDEGERERERGGRAWGSLCACVIESECVAA
ncbi:Hypothetical predicted protein [Marmota monax]|uniref:Uncharacterized protein n=1 Tax=Marmota monax TaxID=9995 RepID=A0A5E4CRE8_MARMO|nr:hypothetical protein GHT09_007496 [Marmota monax]VTJ84403.1 Hypothetical predicted protein [Marmota monax]